MERVDRRYIKDVKAFISILKNEEISPEAESQLEEDEAENPPVDDDPEDHISESENEDDE